MGSDYLDYLHDLFSGFAPVTTRAMFGGHGVYRDGTILAIVIDDALYLKVDDISRPAFEEAGCALRLPDQGQGGAHELLVGARGRAGFAAGVSAMGTARVGRGAAQAGRKAKSPQVRQESQTGAVATA